MENLHELTEAEKVTNCETLNHIRLVQKLLNRCATELIRRGEVHDESKLHSPEVEVFTEFTPKLAGCTYGSEEYNEFLKQMKPALDHHYANNSHHPNFYLNGINGMNLLDIVEMFCDWKAATQRHNDGNMMKSIDINAKRFGMGDELANIFRNTVQSLQCM